MPGLNGQSHHQLLSVLPKDFMKTMTLSKGMTLPWSNGPVEGQINRLKMLKRQMYGRANIDES